MVERDSGYARKALFLTYYGKDDTVFTVFQFMSFLKKFAQFEKYSERQVLLNVLH
jgi:hypothetical protein